MADTHGFLPDTGFLPGPQQLDHDCHLKINRLLMSNAVILALVPRCAARFGLVPQLEP
jgi:hypothetical protein